MKLLFIPVLALFLSTGQIFGAEQLIPPGLEVSVVTEGTERFFFATVVVNDKTPGAYHYLDVFDGVFNVWFPVIESTGAQANRFGGSRLIAEKSSGHWVVFDGKNLVRARVTLVRDPAFAGSR